MGLFKRSKQLASVRFCHVVSDREYHKHHANDVWQKEQMIFALKALRSHLKENGTEHLYSVPMIVDLCGQPWFRNVDSSGMELIAISYPLPKKRK